MSNEYYLAILAILVIGLVLLEKNKKKKQRAYQLKFDPISRRIGGCHDCLPCGASPGYYDDELERRTRVIAETSVR